jgi:RNA polymerase sigma-70 factor (ECF subfamily)
VDDWKERADAAMDRYACGEEAAFGELYDLLAPRLTTFLLRRTRDPARTEELVQQSFLQIHCARQHFSPGAAVMPWAFAIARRLLIDGHRKSQREGRTDPGGEAALEDRPDDREAIDAVVAKRRLAARVQDELALVPEPHRLAFELARSSATSCARSSPARELRRRGIYAASSEPPLARGGGGTS